jgi:hypothetical protein
MNDILNLLRQVMTMLLWKGILLHTLMALLPMVLAIVVSTQLLILLQPTCKLMLINLFSSVVLTI